jgi:hypothetical protein
MCAVHHLTWLAQPGPQPRAYTRGMVRVAGGSEGLCLEVWMTNRIFSNLFISQKCINTSIHIGETMNTNAHKTIRECSVHLELLKNSHHQDELETHLASFVNSARNVTFVLQKEFSGQFVFESWYSGKKLEMEKDELCQFFKKLRNSISKEGNYQFIGYTEISSLQIGGGVNNPPPNATFVVLGGKGSFWLFDGGTKHERYEPVILDGKIITKTRFKDPPKMHMGEVIKDTSAPTLCTLYYEYLKHLIEEFTEILNNQ